MRNYLVLLVVATLASGASADVLWDQPYDGDPWQSLAWADDFTNIPSYSTYSFDDFVVEEPGWRVDEVFISGTDGDSAPENDGVWLTFSTTPDHNEATTVYPGLQDVNEDLYFNMTDDGGVMLEPGTYWISAWVEREFVSDGRFFWDRTTPITGSEHYIHNPGGSWGFGTDPVTGGEWYVGYSKDLSFRIEGTVVPEPASAAFFVLGALAVVFRRRRS